MDALGAAAEEAPADEACQEGLPTGTMQRSSGSFGFIRQDAGGDDMFVMPASCQAFGGMLPPLGTRVCFDVVADSKTGKPRAENVSPAADTDGAIAGPSEGCDDEPGSLAATDDPFNGVGFEGVLTGTMLRSSGSFGFIRRDDGGDNMFVMPAACAAFGGALPPPGTRLCFEVVTDQKTGKPRAENVTRGPGAHGVVSEGFEDASGRSIAVGVPVNEADLDGLSTGTMSRSCGSFGFIRQDGGDDMFVMPAACAAFGGALPPLGTRVCFEVVADHKTGKPRAENVLPDGRIRGPSAGGALSLEGAPRAAIAAGFPFKNADLEGLSTGAMLRNCGNFGFIRQDDGGDSMFVMPAACAAFGGALPPLGTRVCFEVVADQKTGKPRAENVIPDGRIRGPSAYGVVPEGCEGAPGTATAADVLINEPDLDGLLSGTMQRSCGSFGFIRQDDGGDDMFVMPASCAAFGGALPPLGTRVRFEVVTDQKTGKPRAEKVLPDSGDGGSWGGGYAGGGGGRGSGHTSPGSMSQQSNDWGGGLLSGTMLKTNGSFGFIQQDSGEEDMFVMPAACGGWGGQLPAIGDRVLYRIVRDQKTGRPRADEVMPELGDSFGGLCCQDGGKGGYRSHPYGGGTAAPFTAWPGASKASLGKGAGVSRAALPGCDPQLTGTLERVHGSFGFIRQDSGEADMFVMPASCSEFGGMLPPVGTRLGYRVVTDAKTGRPRAEEVVQISD